MLNIQKRYILSFFLLSLFTLCFCGCLGKNGNDSMSGGTKSECAGSYADVKIDSDWLFCKGEIEGAQSVDFDDSAWRRLDLPHDWSIEDLPVQEDAVPELAVVEGQWRFCKGDNADRRAADYDDSSWETVSLPASWENHSGYNEANAYGWFRRNVDIDGAGDVVLLLGYIDDVDEVWFNGFLVGSTGSFPPNYSSAWEQPRRYLVPAEIIKGDGADVIAVRVFDGNGAGGICKAGISSTAIGPFDPANSFGGHFTAHTIGGTGWYRKHFKTDKTGKLISVRFDGVYMNAQVWINGHLLGENPHGYTSFYFDLTDYLNPAGEDNVLAVKVRNEGRNSRWYSGSGIYRHVWLSVKDPVHIPDWGVFVTTPEVSAEKAAVKISTEIENSDITAAEAEVEIRILDQNNDVVSSVNNTVFVDAGSVITVDNVLDVAGPVLWQLDNPYLYSAEVTVVHGDRGDTVCVPFGIRRIEADAEHGFRLNGEMVNLKGGCLHHDNGPLGSAAIDRAEFRKVGLLKANGYNAIRTSHNPPSPALLDACDRLGMLVIDEAFDQWTRSKERNDQDYHNYFKDWYKQDVAAMVRRDRNHPSVVMWSIGNEIPEQFQAEQIQKNLRDEVLRFDDTRFITQAICSDWGRVAENWNELSDPGFKYLDIAGYNYLPEKYQGDRERHPDRVIVTTESYPKDALMYWSQVADHNYVIGDFVWTAMDYLGEAGLAHSILSNEKNSFFMPWPWINAWCGDLDLCGFKKPQSYYRDVVWDRSTIEMAVHTPIPDDLTEVMSSWAWPDEVRSWNWSGYEGQMLSVAVYSRCEKVRLELNGKVIGEKTVGDDITAKFDVPYDAGELCAVGLNGGEEVGRVSLVTSGEPFRIKLSADRQEINADRNDLAYVTVEITDKKGRRVPNAECLVHFSASGAGEFAGQASGNPNMPASFKQPECKTFRGRCIVILRPTGKIGKMALRADSLGLEAAEITVKVR